MLQKRNEPTWPLLCILICLFVLSATSPSLWERAARKRTPPVVATVLESTSSEADTTANAAGALMEVGATDVRGSEAQSGPSGTAKDEPCPAVPGRPAHESQSAVPAVPVARPVAFSAPARPSASSQPASAREEDKPSANHVAAESAPAPSASPPGKAAPLSQPAAELAHAPSLAQPGEEPSQAARPVARAGRLGFTSVEAFRELFLPQEPLTAGMEMPKPVLSADEPPRKVDTPTPAAAEPAPLPDERPQPAPPAPPKSSIASDQTGPSSPQPAGRPTLQPAVRPTLEAPGEASTRQDDWPKPEVLLGQLDEMAREPETREWATGAAKLIRTLGPAMSEGTAESLPLAAKLERLCEQGNQLADKSGDPRVGSKLRRAVYSLDRRLAVWKPIVRAGGLKAPVRDADDDLQPLGSCLAEVDSLLADSPEGRGWRRFLEFDALVKLAGDKAAGSSQARAVARRVLERFAQIPMKAQQRRFLGQGPLETLCRELRRLSSEPVRLEEVLRHVEQFERAGTPTSARILAKDCQSLLSSRLAQKQAIGQGLEGYYRNANIRLVMLGDLLNRFIPERAKEYGDVRDVVLGNPVHGRSLTATKVRLQLVPDPERVHLAFDVNGLVAASTHSIAGAATFYDDSQSVYRGWKEIVLDAEGMHVHPTRVGVNNDLTLRGLSTDFDELPLIGLFAQEVARSQHEQKRCEMS
jgi:hypothetical protein